MRPKVVVTVLCLAFGFLGMLAILTRKPAGNSPPLVHESNAAPRNSAGAAPSGEFFPARVEFAAPAPSGKEAVSNHEEYVQQRISELQTLQMNDDRNSLQEILSELTNADRPIRQAAREAAVQFGDRSAIPFLKERAEQTDDPVEKADLLAAADYLSLPTLSEHRASPVATRPAPSRMPSSSTNRARRNFF